MFHQGKTLESQGMQPKQRVKHTVSLVTPVLACCYPCRYGNGPGPKMTITQGFRLLLSVVYCEKGILYMENRFPRGIEQLSEILSGIKGSVPFI